MSRIGGKHIDIPSGVTVSIQNGEVAVKGSKGTLSYIPPQVISVKQEGSKLICERQNDDREQKAFHGLVRSLVNNMVLGVDKGFSKSLEIHGVGYRAQMQGKNLVLNIGFSHPVEYTIPSDINIEVKGTAITISGIDKQKVGAVAAKIRSYYPPEPYKGKGIRYVGEHVRRKAGKTVGK